tara:strand:- start:418 stop:600 length:183 start_codon:yes stop_codon:yes gene_type:complete
VIYNVMIAICLKVEVVLTRLLKHIIFLRERMEYSRMTPKDRVDNWFRIDQESKRENGYGL